MVKYFFDSYAIIEIIKGNHNYIKFIKEEVTITIFNLVEIYWSSLNDLNEEAADEIFTKYKNALVDTNDNILKEAIKFRKENKKKNLSYTDCIGYIYALKNKMVFLTGDKEFEKLPNVEFVK